MKTIYLIFIYIPSTEETQGVYTLLKFRDTGKRVNEDKTPVCLSCVVHPVGWAGKHLHIPLPLTKRYIQ